MRLFAESLEFCTETGNVDLLSTIGQNQARAGYFDQALATSDLIKEHGAPNKSDVEACLMTIAIEMAKRQQFVSAEETCHRLGIGLERTLALTKLAVNLFDAGEFDKSKSIIHDAIESSDRESNSFSQMLAYHAVLAAMKKTGMNKDVSDLLAKKRNSIVRPIEWWYLGQLVAEFGSLEDTKYIASQHVEQLSMPHADEMGLSLLAWAQANAGLVDDAQMTCMQLEKWSGFGLAASRVAEACIRAGRLSEAADLVERIKDKRVGYGYIQTMLDIAAAAVTKGNVELGKKYLKTSRSFLVSDKVQDKRDEVYLLAGQFHGKFGMDNEFESWIESIESPDAKAYALIGLANGMLNRANDLDKNK